MATTMYNFLYNTFCRYIDSIRVPVTQSVDGQIDSFPSDAGLDFCLHSCVECELAKAFCQTKSTAMVF